MKKAYLIIAAVLLIDQIVKVYIKTNFYLGEEIRVFDWWRIHFTENNGMAFGLEFGGVWGKLALSLFRIGAVIAIGYYLKSLIDKGAKGIVVVAFSLIMAGALGNIIDSAFYGLLFGESYGQVAAFLPDGGGYAGFLQGRVVDMLYFPIWKGYLPDWLPFWGGDYFVFFRPVFNIADSAISIGVALLILFQKQAFSAMEAE
ncbi:MAG: lipoprotein signal peptidase [Flavobacteriales bacterium]|nr:lipoprotein signal peptidase [Flavobacteriales bacterium]